MIVIKLSTCCSSASLPLRCYDFDILNILGDALVVDVAYNRSIAGAADNEEDAKPLFEPNHNRCGCMPTIELLI